MIVNTSEEERTSTYKIPCTDAVQCVEFCPFDWSCNLLAVGKTVGISVFSCRFQVSLYTLLSLDLDLEYRSKLNVLVNMH